MAEQDVVERLKDATYVAVGLGVLGAQRLLVGRREVVKRVEPQVRGAASQLQRLATATDEKVNPLLYQMEERLPPATRDLVRTARGKATGARDAVLTRVASGS
ncbi:MAG TPA: hypothetical protein VG078_07605 [Acidimicrobiales bacterium]|nr:hypothetical protein [Acidimicrobiales bacterium]